MVAAARRFPEPPVCTVSAFLCLAAGHCSGCMLLQSLHFHQSVTHECASPPDATQQLEVSSDRGTPPSSLPSPPTPRPTGPAAASGERGGTRAGGVVGGGP